METQINVALTWITLGDFSTDNTKKYKMTLSRIIGIQLKCLSVSHSVENGIIVSQYFRMTKI